MQFANKIESHFDYSLLTTVRRMLDITTVVESPRRHGVSFWHTPYTKDKTENDKQISFLISRSFTSTYLDKSKQHSKRKHASI